MSRFPACAPLVLALAAALPLGGCHIVHRAEQCKQLAQLINAHEAELAPQLSESPSSTALLYKAKLYREMAKELKETPVNDKRVSKERDTLVSQLGELADHLIEVEKIVAKEAALAAQLLAEEQAAEQAEKETAEHEEASADPAKEGEAPNTEPAAAEASDQDQAVASSQAPDNAPPAAPAEATKKRMRPRGVAAAIDTVAKARKERGGPPKQPRPNSLEAQRTANRRGYMRQRGAIEELKQNIERSVHGISNACRE